MGGGIACQEKNLPPAKITLQKTFGFGKTNYNKTLRLYKPNGRERDLRKEFL